MTQHINCKTCGTLCLELRDAKVRNNIVVYCEKCAPENIKQKRQDSKIDMLDIIGDIFGKHKW